MPTTDTITRKPLLTALVPGGKTIARVHAAAIDLAPGQQSGLHIHPIPVVGHVTAGEITFQIAGQPSTTLRAGDAFYEPAHTKMEHFDNASAHAPASFVAYYLLGQDDKELITMLPRDGG
jgi:quercetin dioxygenase-like cupin family protein